MEQSLAEALLRSVQQGGLLGVFFAGFVGNAVPFSAVPYLAYIAAFSASAENVSRVGVAVVGGVGAALGKYALYAIFRNASRALPESMQESLAYFNEVAAKGLLGFFVVLLFAATPLPDDVVYVPLSAAKFSFPAFAAAVLLGKVLLTSLAVFFGAQARWLITTSLESGHALLGVGGLVAATLILLVVVFAVDWKKVALALAAEGVRGGLRTFLKELFLLATFRHTSLKKAAEKLAAAVKEGRSS